MKTSRTMAVLFAVSAFGCNDDFGTSPPLKPITAAQRLSQVISFSHSSNMSLQLVGIFTNDLDTTGRSISWSYCFVDSSVTAPLWYWYHATSQDVKFDSVSQRLDGPHLAGTDAITLSWIDSDQAMFYASHSSSRFTDQNPEYVIAGSLGQAHISDYLFVSWGIFYTSKVDTNKTFLIVVDAGPV